VDLVTRFKQYIQQENLFLAKDQLLLAVSGGVDSVVLCELCHKAGYNISIAHCNFKLRGKESERDKEFVEELAKKYEVAFLVKKFDTLKYAETRKKSVQEAARELRYEWFLELIGEKKYAIGNRQFAMDWILTAHHLDDNIETMLMNFFKGTGIAGLRGILPRQGKIIRPLLFARKEELVLYARENNLTWVEDSSNETDNYTRNYFRHQVIPLIEKIYPDALNNLAENLNRFRDIEVLYRQYIALHKKKLLELKGNEAHVPILKLKKSEPFHTIIYEIIRDFGFTPQQVNEVIHLLDSESGKYIRSPTHRIIKNRAWLIIAPVQTENAQTILIEEGEKNVKFANGKLQIELLAKCPLPIDNCHGCLDATEIKFPLLLRSWKQGDYFYPLGMKKKKKLSRFFIDNKISKTDKEKVWVLEMDKKIVWVVGMRIDERFKVSDKTKSVLKITLSK
jgi:tRNA(Ile)-lysidine synthase